MNAAVASPTRRRRIGVVVFAVIAVKLFVWFLILPSDEQRSADAARAADEKYLASDYAAAEELALQAFEWDAARYDALLLAADCAVAAQQYDRAVDHLKRVPADAGSWFTRAAAAQAEILHHRLFRLGAAEAAYRAALEVDPDQPELNEQLAMLLSVCGRRDDAIPHVLRLIRQGVETDLVILLARESGSLDDEPLLRLAMSADPLDANPLTGLAARAVARNDSAAAVTWLQQATALPNASDAAWAMLGRQLVVTDETQQFSQWWQNLPESAREQPDVWLALAIVADRQNDAAAAARCWWEVLSRRPESRQAASRLSRNLTILQRPADAAACTDWSQRLQALAQAQHRALFSDDEHRYEDLVDLFRRCIDAGRWWEAATWGRVAVQMVPDDSRVVEELLRIEDALPDLPLTITHPDMSPSQHIDVADLTAPDLPGLVRGMEPSAASDEPDATMPFVFQNDAATIGLDFRYHNGAPDGPQHRMFEFTGGGVAVLDFDRDEWPDVFFTQGRMWEKEADETDVNAEVAGDRLKRNVRGESFFDVTLAAGITENGFGQGATVGDLNCDGFPDVYVANTHQNAVWLNNGDGTYSREPLAATASQVWWTTSCLMADLNGDHLVDLYDVNYVTAADVFDRTCRSANGSVILCAPHDFDPAPDQIWLNEGDGTLVNRTDRLLAEPDGGNGLGIVAWREMGNDALSLFIANDKTANRLLRRTGRGADTQLQDWGLAAGVAFNGKGDAEACMGVAAGDVDHDGMLDLLVTNFWHETNTLYTATPGGFFSDRTFQSGLGDPSLDVLGFGTQFLDVDNDGELELFVANGHIEDVGMAQQPFRMPPFLFAGRQGNFVLTEPADAGAYFSKRWTGRAAARWDWNADGRDDLIVGHLHDEYAVLTNLTPDAGNCLSLRLCGALDRVPIGAQVAVSIDNRRRVFQLTAGDGYHCSNERRLNIGCGRATVVDHLEIQWPGGDSLILDDVPLANRYVVDERTGRLLKLPAATLRSE